MFQTEEGNPLGNNVLRSFRRIVKRAGIKPCNLYDLRRTFISHLAMAGVNEAVVQQLAGHASMQTTLKHYTAIMPEAAQEAQARLPWASCQAIVPKSYPKPSSGSKGKAARVVSLDRAAS